MRSVNENLNARIFLIKREFAKPWEPFSIDQVHFFWFFSYKDLKDNENVIDIERPYSEERYVDWWKEEQIYRLIGTPMINLNWAGFLTS